MKYLIWLTACSFFFINSLQAQNSVQDHPDYEAVHAAISDYVEALYEVDSSKIKRSVHPELVKKGFWFNQKDSVWNDNTSMSYQRLVNLAGSWNRSGERANANSPKEIEIYDINEKTAVGKLTAEWGIDFFQLAKMEGKWMIMNVIWQSVPEND